MGGRGAAAEGGREPAAAITPWPHHGTLKSPDRHGDPKFLRATGVAARRKPPCDGRCDNMKLLIYTL